MKHKTIIINEDLDTSRITDPNLLQMAINIQGQKANARKAFDTQQQTFDKQLLDILKKQDTIDNQRNKTIKNDDENTSTRPEVKNNQTNTTNTNTSNNQQIQSNENYIYIKPFTSWLNEEDDIIVNKTHPTIYIEFTDAANTCVGKIFKIDDNSKWICKLISGISPEFKDLSFESDMNMESIIEKLSSIYKDVVKIDYDEYNNKVESTEDIIGDVNLNEDDLNYHFDFSECNPEQQAYFQKLIDSIDLQDIYEHLPQNIIDIFNQPITRQEKYTLLYNEKYSDEDINDILDILDRISRDKYTLEQHMKQ